MQSPSAADLRRTALAAFLLAAVAAVVYHGPSILSGARLFFTHDLSRSDLWHLHYPLKHFYAAELAEWRLPFWCPGVGGGFPLFAEGQVGALYPPNLLLFGLLPLPLAFNLSILTTAIVAATGAALFARQFGAGRTASLLAAVVFTFSAFMVTHVKHTNMTAAAAWLPWLLFLLDRFATTRRPRHLAGMAAVTAVMILAGHPQIAYINLLLTGLYTPIAWARGECNWRIVGGAVAAVALGALLAMPQILPTRELVQQGARKGGLSFEQATHWDYDPAYLLTFVAPFHFGEPSTLTARPGEDRARGFRPVADSKHFYWEVVGYVGLLPLALALLALWPGRGARRAVALLVLAAICLLIVLGRHGGLAALCHAYLPGFNAFRFPCRFLLPISLLLAVLAALGLTRLGAVVANRRSWWRRAVPAVAVAVCFLDLYLTFADHNPTIAASAWTTPPESVRDIRRAEGEHTAPFRLAQFDPDRFVFINCYRRAGGWNHHHADYEPAKQMVYADQNLLWGLDNLDFYHPLFPAASARLLALYRMPDLARGLPPNTRIASLFNVRYLLTPAAAVAGQPGFTPIARYPGGENLTGGGGTYEILLLRNERALPRALLVPEAVFLTSADPYREAVARLARADFDPRLTVLITGAPDPADAMSPAAMSPAAMSPARGPPAPAITAPVTWIERGSTRRVLEVDAPRAAWLFLSETWYPGWRAEVDGEAVPIRRANVAGRAIRVPTGRHRITFAYRPTDFTRALILAALGLVGVALLLLADCRRLSRSAPAPGR